MIDFLRLGGLIASAALIAVSGLAGAADAPGSAASAAPTSSMPPAECTAALDRLSNGIPPAETGPALRRQGLRIRTPIVVPEGVLTETGVTSAARVRIELDSRGQVRPGSVTVQQSIGDPKLPLALSQAVPQTLSFDVGGAFTVPEKFVFTTVYVVCARK